MPGFPLAALGAGLGIWAKNQQEQQAARERQQMLMLTLQRFQQEQQDRQENRDITGGIFSAAAGGGGLGGQGIRPVGTPVSQAAPVALGLDAARGQPNSTEVPFQYGPSSRAPGESAPRVVGTPMPGGNSANPWQNPLIPDPAILAPKTLTPMRTPPAMAGGNPGVAGTGAPAPGTPYDTSTTETLDTRGGGGFAPPRQVADAGTVDPDTQRAIRQIQSTTPQHGRSTIDELAARIQQTIPNASNYAKGQALLGLQKLLGPEEQERVRALAAERSAERADDRADRRSADQDRRTAAREADKNWDLLTDPTSGQQYWVQKGKPKSAVDLSGQPYKPGGAARVSGGGTGSASAGREADISKEIVRRDAEWDAAHPGASNSDKSKAHFDNRKAAEKELTAAKTSETRSTLANIAMRKLRDEHPEWDGKDLLRESSKIIAQQATDRNFAGGSGATQMRSLNTVADHLKLMSEYSEALRNGTMPFTEIPRLNQIIQFAAKERGMPEVTNFNVARDIMADEVVRLLTSTGGTEADRAGMQGRLAAAMSEYQQTGALTAFERFTAGRFKGLEQGYTRNDPERTKDFRENMLTPEARQIFTKHGISSEAAPAAAPATGGAAVPSATRVPVPPGAANDPDGTSYQNDKGVWVKQGKELVLTPGAVKTP